MKTFKFADLNKNNAALEVGDIIDINNNQKITITHINNFHRRFSSHFENANDLVIHANYESGSRTGEASGSIQQIVSWLADRGL